MELEKSELAAVKKGRRIYDADYAGTSSVERKFVAMLRKLCAVNFQNKGAMRRHKLLMVHYYSLDTCKARLSIRCFQSRLSS